MITKPLPAPAKPGTLSSRPRHFAPYRLARMLLISLVVIGVIAVVLLVLGLLHVHAVTNHFSIH
jgi:hypothetical protein